MCRDCNILLRDVAGISGQKGSSRDDQQSCGEIGRTRQFPDDQGDDKDDDTEPNRVDQDGEQDKGKHVPSRSRAVLVHARLYLTPPVFVSACSVVFRQHKPDGNNRDRRRCWA